MNKLKAIYWDVDGTIADTEMFGHRIAFNRAFLEFGLEWLWDNATYKSLLAISGGFHRIKYYSINTNKIISDEYIKAIHKKKQLFYKEILLSGEIPLRTGVARLIKQLYKQNIQQTF